MFKKLFRIGNQTSFSASDMMQPFEFAVAHGFDAFEWFPDKKGPSTGWIEDDLSREARAWIKETALIHDISLSVHAPLSANPFNSGDTEKLFKAIAFAQDIGASLFNVHFYPQKGIAAYIGSLAPFLEPLVAAGIRLSIENTPDIGPEDFNELFAYFRNYRNQSGYAFQAGICLDLGHANLYPFTRNDYLKFVDLLDPDIPIIHIHMHENYGDFDSHLSIFTGPAGRDPSGMEGFFERMIMRNFSGSVILEQWPQNPDVLIESRNRLLRVMNDQAKESLKSASMQGTTLCKLGTRDKVMQRR
jgi:sugar phosphate isomerase/epimerase